MVEALDVPALLCRSVVEGFDGPALLCRSVVEALDVPALLCRSVVEAFDGPALLCRSVVEALGGPAMSSLVEADVLNNDLRENGGSGEGDLDRGGVNMTGENGLAGEDALGCGE